MAVDPICGMYVREDEHALRADRGGRTYYFCSDTCRRTFLAPEKDLRRLQVGAASSFALSALILLVMFAPRLPAALDSMPARNVILLALATPVQFLAGARFYRGLAHAVRRRVANMDSLIALGTSAAYFFSAAVVLWPERLGDETYFDTSAIIIAFILFGRVLEHRMKARATDALRRLLDLQPRTARLVRDGTEREISLDQLGVGDRFRLGPGQRVATDGRLHEGRGSFDESMVTGESLPVAKGVGDDVVGGTINLDGNVVVEATRVGADTALAQIVQLVEQAQSGRAPIQRLVDTVSAYFVPTVLAIAAASFLGWWTLGGLGAGRALLPLVAVLIVACPCALGLATPAALLVGVGRAAEQGILVKETDQFERLARADLVLFDKTGTLTLGQPQVTDVRPVPGPTPQEVLRVAASAEEPSIHPLARAVVRRARDDAVPLAPAADFHQEPGLGVRAQLEGQRVLVGTPAWLERHGVDADPARIDAERLHGEGKTVLYVARGTHVLGLLAVQDTIKPGAKEAIDALHRLGLRTALVTGDHEATARAVAAQLDIPTVDAQVMPPDKAARVRRHQGEGHRVVMVGDGINDAPALAQADVGIALGGGTDVAREAGGLVLLKDDPRDVANAVRLARLTLRKIHQNLFWAFVYNVLLIPVAALGLLRPILAGAAMAVSSVTVVGNSLLLRRRRPFLEAHSTRGARGRREPPSRAQPLPKRPKDLPLAMRGSRTGAEVDPVCGMRVDPATAAGSFPHEGRTYYFCSPGCRQRFERDPQAFLGRAASPSAGAGN